MTLNWMIYTLAVTVLIGAAATATERALRLWKLPTRWIWMAAMVASTVPPLFVNGSAPLPTQDARSAPVRRAAPAAALPGTQAASEWVAAKTAATPIEAAAMLKPAWMALSVTLLLALGASAALLAMRRRHWRSAHMGDTPVWIAPDAGPAVVGILRPRIVLPEWLMQTAPSQQALVMAHETSHVAARDPQLLALALLLLAVMPWNLALWWQLRRLRHAIEVDCDARVLAAGHNLQAYGEALLEVGARQSGLLGSMAAMAESRSLLEQRLGIMVRGPGRWRRAAAVGLAATALCAAAAAAQLAPPAPAKRAVVQLAPAQLAEYEGTYQVGEFQVMTITRYDDRLISEITGRGPLLLFAERKDKLYQPRSGLDLLFQRNAGGKVVGMTLTRLGVDIIAPRVEGTDLKRRIAAHLARDGAMPGGEAALRRGADSLTTGKVYEEDLTPAFARISRVFLAERVKALQKNPVGKMQSISYEGVNRDTGEDIYKVVYEHRVVDWYLTVNSDGKVDGAFARFLRQ
ncbi:M56 family metallopeptidase [Massilia sp. CF038]|uniref:M56 family metallopeptidase n=1 Tax=Massilia sp. CF038 TaxID=1881045 RepID=UPI0009181760|nr:M56 family metallopeptidase [Massilia sp. CF038]SHH55870.1 Signal transducer regulating beta-lactamase production, contains metallopeptidase domain [Massilia sp. CF038]